MCICGCILVRMYMHVFEHLNVVFFPLEHKKKRWENRERGMREWERKREIERVCDTAHEKHVILAFSAFCIQAFYTLLYLQLSGFHVCTCGLPREKALQIPRWLFMEVRPQQMGFLWLADVFASEAWRQWSRWQVLIVVETQVSTQGNLKSSMVNSPWIIHIHVLMQTLYCFSFILSHFFFSLAFSLPHSLSFSFLPCTRFKNPTDIMRFSLEHPVWFNTHRLWIMNADSFHFFI